MKNNFSAFIFVTICIVINTKGTSHTNENTGIELH